ncbi:MAG TPA: tRNA lysidine(34) synthetase TilS [Opitutaceae bacterium]
MKKRRPFDWPGAAERAALLLPVGRLHAPAVQWAQARARSEGWAVALSGGADSVALLLLVWAHWPERRARLRAFHFDHRIRGAESSADARFCASLCAGLGVPLLSGKWSASREKRAEAQSRDARFAFIERGMAAKRMRVLLLGHQQDDIAETMLMRVARGSGSSGLAAPRGVHGLPARRAGGRERFHVRPLLSLKKAEITRALRTAGVPWREDSSNKEGAHFRNRLRMGVISRWVRASGRDALAGAALSRELLEEDDRALEAWVDLLNPLEGGRSLSVSRLGGRPRAVVRRALHRWLLLQPRAGELSRQGFEVLLRAVERGTAFRHSLGRHGFAVIGAGKLRFERIRKPSSLD